MPLKLCFCNAGSGSTEDSPWSSLSSHDDVVRITKYLAVQILLQGVVSVIIVYHAHHWRRFLLHNFISIFCLRHSHD